MPEIRINPYQIMWLIVMFDLPTATLKDRKAYALFKKCLEQDGFVIFQFSVYMRYCGSLESASAHVQRVRSFVPQKGKVSVLSITDKQYGNIINIWGNIEKKNPRQPMQLELF